MGPIHPSYIVDERGKRQGVILKMEEFEELLECIEDVFDVQEMERLRAEPTVSWEDVKAKRASGQS